MRFEIQLGLSLTELEHYPTEKIDQGGHREAQRGDAKNAPSAFRHEHKPMVQQQTNDSAPYISAQRHQLIDAHTVACRAYPHGDEYPA
jgi:hypothetical protein